MKRTMLLLLSFALSPMAHALDNGGGGGIGLYFCTLGCDLRYGDCDNSDPTSVLKSIDFKCVAALDACKRDCSNGGGSGGSVLTHLESDPSRLVSPVPAPACTASSARRDGAAVPSDDRMAEAPVRALPLR